MVVLTMSMKQIKISDKVKEELDNIKLDKETYNITIQRLIYENKQLKHDKEMLMQIAVNNK